MYGLSNPSHSFLNCLDPEHNGGNGRWTYVYIQFRVFIESLIRLVGCSSESPKNAIEKPESKTRVKYYIFSIRLQVSTGSNGHDMTIRSIVHDCRLIWVSFPIKTVGTLYTYNILFYSVVIFADTKRI